MALFLESQVMISHAKFNIGQIVKHRLFDFHGVIFDVDPTFSNSEEWYQSIPEEIRPRRDQPFYHLFAQNSETEYVAYVSEQNLVPTDDSDPLRHPEISERFSLSAEGQYQLLARHSH